MEKILVTGAIASGKSEVCRYLESKGYPIYYSDARTKSLYNSVPGLKERIEKELEIDFEEIAVIFKDDVKRQKLEDIVYPIVVEDFKNWMSGQTADSVVFESAIALEKRQFDGLFDKVILVKADIRTRISRNSKVIERNHIQNPDESKADFVIENDSDIEALHKTIDSVLSLK